MSMERRRNQLNLEVFCKQNAAVSIANSCEYCIHSHTAAARAKGMTEEQYAEFLSIVSLAGRTNHLLNGIKVPVDPEFDYS